MNDISIRHDAQTTLHSGVNINLDATGEIHQYMQIEYEQAQMSVQFILYACMKVKMFSKQTLIFQDLNRF